MKKTVQTETAEASPFETCEQSEGQNMIDDASDQFSTEARDSLIDEDFSQSGEVEIIKEALTDDGSHKCDTCALDFATCESKSVQFGIDRYPEANGKEADRIISCGSHVPKLTLADCVAYSPSPLDRFGKKFTKDLPVPVPEDELARYAQDMARLHALWVRTKLDAKDFAKSCKEVTDRCEKQELEIAEIINAGEELRGVTVYWSYDFTHHVKRLVRTDTCEVVEEAALAPEDYQSDLPLFDTVDEAQTAEVFETGTLEGDSGGETVTTSHNENSEVFDPALDEIAQNYSDKTEDLDKGWPDPPERQS